jgi:3-phenylpropionate/trans-cinnamate dioxygenase ferredoxin reductase component
MTIVLIGAGLAAQRCAQTLRRRGHDGRILLLGDEGRLPYDRPPLSKENLKQPTELALRPRAWYDEHAVELHLGDPAVALDPHGRTVATRSGALLRYDRVLIATGARPIALPGTEGLANVHALRTAGDAAALAERLRPGARLAIAGAGFIGQEVAQTALALGVEVTLIEALPAPLHAVLGPELGGWFAQLHRDAGVDVRLASRIAGFDGQVVVLHDGGRIECDALLVGIGVRPDTAWLATTGLPPHGIPVAHDGATAIPHVFAAGDVALGHHWEAAVAQGIAAAHGMLGLQPPPHPRPSFWSDLGGLRVQLAGDPRGADEVVIDGDPDARDFTALLLRDGIVRAGLLVGRPRALPALRDQLDHSLPDRRTA